MILRTAPGYDIYRGERDIERRVRRLSTLGTTAARRGRGGGGGGGNGERFNKCTVLKA